jgi:SAM-dependent methyltransferase
MESSTASPKSSWGTRFRKAGRYLSHGDLTGLAHEVQQFWAWSHTEKLSPPSTPSSVTEAEATFWDRFNVDLGRAVSWGNAGDFGRWAFEEGAAGRWPGIIDLIADCMEVSSTQDLRGLVLGCGDMAAEHQMFVTPRLPFAEVDAYDVSIGSIERARKLTDEKGLNVHYHVADVNQIRLPANRYALILVFHAFHHFERIDHVTRQINQALVPGGVFYTVDYIGPCRLQHSERQLFYAQLLLDALPDRYRRQVDGTIRQQVRPVALDLISPDEAICSAQILPAIARHMRVRWQHNWGGLLYPLLEGLGSNFDKTSPQDQMIARFLFILDSVLCRTREVEPNFTYTLATKKWQFTLPLKRLRTTEER